MNNRSRLLDVMKILNELTDPEHHLSAGKIAMMMGKDKTQGTRRTVEEDIDAIQAAGTDVMRDPRTGDYYIRSRTPDKVETAILAECVLNSKLFTEQKTKELIGRLTSCLSIYQRSNITGRMLISGRIKSRNENIYYIVEKIQEAIVSNSCISFRYFSWGENCSEVYHNNGLPVCVSPYFTVFDDENFYLIGYAHYAKDKRHYRIDKMKDVTIISRERAGEEIFKEEKVTDYTTRRFGMFDGEQVRITLLCRTGMYNVIYDRFGRDIRCSPVDESHFKTTVTVSNSKLFFGWLFSMGEEIMLTGPEDVLSQYKRYLDLQEAIYGRIQSPDFSA